MAAHQSFVALCAALNIPVDGTKKKIEPFLREAGVALPSNNSVGHLKEVAASLAWARNSISNGADPDSWINDVGPTGVALLQTLYPLPPASNPGDSDCKRLARSITLYMATGSTPAPPSPAPTQPLPTGAAINTARTSPPRAASATTPAPAAPVVIVIPSPSASPLKRKAQMMHDDLEPLLNESVFRALDAYANASIKEREKVVSLCRNQGGSSYFNPTVHAAFGHQISLLLAEGDFFDAPARGNAFAIAGRSAAQPGAEGTGFGHGINMLAAFQSLQKQWPAILSALVAPSELSGSLVDTLWTGASVVLDLRAERATRWNCPEVLSACVKQRDDLAAYRTAVAKAVARLADPSSPTVTARNINTAYLQFFLPFWTEHILGKARLDETAAAKEVKSIMAETPVVANPPAAPPPALAPPAYIPPAHYYFPPPPPPGFPQHPAGWHHPPPPPALPSPQKARRFAGKPISPLIIGTTLGVQATKPGKRCHCAVHAAFPGREHFSFECPMAYHLLHGTCPGWTAAGARIPSCWTGDDITPTCRTEWRNFAATLPVSHTAGHVQVAF